MNRVEGVLCASISGFSIVSNVPVCGMGSALSGCLLNK